MYFFISHHLRIISQASYTNTHRHTRIENTHTTLISQLTIDIHPSIPFIE